VRIRIISVGRQMPTWIHQGFNTYQKRMGQDMQVELCEINAGKRVKHADLQRLINQEGMAILNAIKPRERVIALTIQGKSFSTESMAQQLAAWQQDGQDLCFLIGGPEGLAETVVTRADHQWSLSDLTLPHPLVRVLLAEQLYRCWSIIKRMPYHR